MNLNRIACFVLGLFVLSIVGCVSAIDMKVGRGQARLDSEAHAWRGFDATSDENGASLTLGVVTLGADADLGERWEPDLVHFDFSVGKTPSDDNQ